MLSLDFIYEKVTEYKSPKIRNLREETNIIQANKRAKFKKVILLEELICTKIVIMYSHKIKVNP